MKLWKQFLPFYILVIGLFLAGIFLGNHAVSVFSESTPIQREHCIVIDAGHGGEDGGATSCTGVLESQINLEIALRLDDLFHLLGYDTRMIRTTDTAVYTSGSTIAQKKASDLRERVRIVNETENALLISIHQNTFSDSQYSGGQIFYAVTQGSEELAKSMQTAFASALNPGSNRQAKRSTGIYLMENIQTAGVLVECGFLSNAQEEARLRTDAYQKQICAVIAASVSMFLSNT